MSNYHTLSVGYNSFHIDERYSNLKPIGDGSYGFVASATDKVTGNKVAIKKVKDTFIDVVDAKRILREIKLLNHFDKHENIITIHDIMTYPPNKEHFDDIYIVTNLMESDLERIIRSRQVLTDQHLQYFLFQILRGMKYVHSANVLHRDLKPSNLLVNANCDLALCDFGLARGFDAGVDQLTEYVVTRWYRPPELLLECAMYGKPVDVWSVGCIFAEVIIHEPFFRGDNPQHQLQVIVSKLGLPSKEKLRFIDSKDGLLEVSRIQARQPPPFSSWFPSSTNPQALDLMSKMMRFNPDDRISVEDALAHPYLQDFHGQMAEPSCDRLFDFEFERRAEVRRCMFEEVCRYRPVAGSKGGGGGGGG
eukprot:CAMPEP_0181293022 /NCGR_PEP_ID=MMETSP1101-20121128/2833_1 /TAXON_ID=46948 /ORGANISM="Rhodomonas abbreviata, Strain Caron Lab Isolate" /LENGTH=362 /DNA_ID=CAMNT_0023397561 /DNA_START=213 /DNA_END=1297 /DNA_ORIENTATION=-